MLKKILLASAASAVLALSAQGAATPVYAQANIKPKVKVAPKARIRVVKPRVRIRVDTKRLAKKKQNSANGQQPTPTVATHTTSRLPRTASMPKPTADLTKGLPEDKAAELAQIKELREAVEQSKSIASLDVVGVSLGLGDPLNPDENQSEENPADGEAPQTGGSGLTPPGSDQFGNPLAGAGVDHAAFGFLANSNGTAPRNSSGSRAADAAKDAVGVTPGRIASAIGGVASTDTVQYGQGGDKNYQYEMFSGNARYVNRGTELADGTYMVEHLSYSPDGETYEWHLYRNSEDTSPENEIDGGSVRYDNDVAELRNPDYVDGGGKHPFYWLDKPQETLLDRVAGFGPGGLPPAPDGTQPPGHNGGTPIVSKDDLVSNYDPDSSQKGSRPTPIPLCFHSEC